MLCKTITHSEKKCTIHVTRLCYGLVSQAIKSVPCKALADQFVFELVLFFPGWVTILAEWINSPDLALSMLAAKALANLDRDYGELKLYEDAVHLYYPKHRYR